MKSGNSPKGVSLRQKAEEQYKKLHSVKITSLFAHAKNCRSKADNLKLLLEFEMQNDAIVTVNGETVINCTRMPILFFPESNVR